MSALPDDSVLQDAGELAVACVKPHPGPELLSNPVSVTVEFLFLFVPITLGVLRLYRKRTSSGSIDSDSSDMPSVAISGR